MNVPPQPWTRLSPNALHTPALIARGQAVVRMHAQRTPGAACPAAAAAQAWLSSSRYERAHASLYLCWLRALLLLHPLVCRSRSVARLVTSTPLDSAPPLPLFSGPQAPVLVAASHPPTLL